MLLEEDKDGALSQEIRPSQNFNDWDIFLTVSRSILFLSWAPLEAHDQPMTFQFLML